jgi:ATP phosphoribosyltransferase
MDTEPRIKIAIQKSGRLADNSLELLKRCGLKISRGTDQLICYGENMPVDVLLVRDDDIPALVADGTCELGIVGRNVLMEKTAARGGAESLTTMCDLDFGHCRLALAVPKGEAYEGAGSVAGRRIATSYPGILDTWLSQQGLSASVVVFAGAVEIAPQLGRADLVCDLVSTGSTLAANELVEVETILESHAVVIAGEAAQLPAASPWIARLTARIAGVVRVRESKYIMLHAPRPALARIRDLLPGSEAPTVIPLDGVDDKVAVHAVCREDVFWETLESLRGAGASSVLVLPVEKMLA